MHVTLSSGISGSFNSACAAAQVLREKYPERKLYIVDSLGASSGYGLIIDKMAELRDSGMNIDALHDWVEEHKLNMHHWFFSTDLTYYVRGGRISKSAGFIGSILHICPLLNCDDLGRLTPRAKIRTKKRAINEIVQKWSRMRRTDLIIPKSASFAIQLAMTMHVRLRILLKRLSRSLTARC